MSDEIWMKQAIALGEKGRVTAPPNPWVGCVIVNEGRLVGEGYHLAKGKPHAEAIALKMAGTDAKGATAYVTLEPCVHQGETPPCANALIDAGLARVVVGILDPDSKVSGAGVGLIKSFGVPVTVGICENDIERSLRPYLHHRRTGLPYVVAKGAVSVDGRIAAANGSSQWISGEAARADAHLLRAHSQAVIVGSNTVRMDNPRLTVRGGISVGKQPLRVVLGDVPRRGHLFEDGKETLVYENGYELNRVLQDLGKRNILQVLVEGGGRVLGSFMSQNLVDELNIYIGSIILGDLGIPLFSELSIANMETGKKLTLEEAKRLEDTVKLTYTVLGVT